MQNKIFHSIECYMFSFASILPFLFITQHANATHIAGGQLTYAYLGNNGLDYRLTYTFYRDCGGAPAPGTVTINTSSASAGVNFNTISGAGVNNGNVVPICPTANTTCTGGGTPGCAEWVYQADITLPSERTDWVFSVSLITRNAAITTISPTAVPMYVYATLNNTIAPYNNSSVFANKPAAFVYANQNFCFNNGTVDVDGDSLVYSLITPKSTATLDVNYVVPYTATQPLTSAPPVTFSATNGDVCMTPTLIEVTVMAVLVQEYRWGQLIGSVERDIQVNVVAGADNLPYIDGINSTGIYEDTIPAGCNYSFTTQSFDADATQCVTMSSNVAVAMLLGATFLVSGGCPFLSMPTGTFDWIPGAGDVRSQPYAFTVTVQDNGCNISGQQVRAFSLWVIDFTADFTSSAPACVGQSVNFYSIQPPNNYSYLWDFGVDAVATSAQTTSANPAGITYTSAGVKTVQLTITGTGCVKTASNVITINPSPTANAGTDQTVCANNADVALNGSFTIATDGIWSSSGSGSFLPDATTMNATYTPSAADIASGNVTLTLTTTGNGICSPVSDDMIITITPAPTANAGTDQTVCANNADVVLNGSFAIATGGTWSSSGSGIFSPDAVTMSATYIPSAADIASGNVTLTLTTTGNGNCIAAGDAIAITITPAPSANAGTDVSVCSGSTTTLNATGNGTFVWSPSAGLSCITCSNPTANPAVTTTYTVGVTNSCGTAYDAVVITVQTISVSVSATPASCSSSNGSAAASISGAVLPVRILWNTGDTLSTINGLPAGIYRVNVTDAKGCFSFADALVSNTGGLSITLNSATDVSCNGIADGTIDINVSGTPPYTYSWSNGATTQDISSISYGPYEVTVTDAGGCTATQSIFVNQPAPMVISSSVINSSCAVSNGSALVIVSGGTSPYTYLWSNGSTTSSIAGIGAGVYKANINDSLGCFDSLLVAVSDSGGPIVFVDTIAAVNCGSKGFVLITPQDSLTIQSYQWTTGSTTQNLTDAAVGVYGLIVTDTAGCKSALVIPVNPVLPPLKPLCVVTVDTLTKKNIIVWEKPLISLIAGFNIYRESSQNGIYQFIKYWDYSNVSTYYDSIAKPNDHWSKYRISMKDICGNEGHHSPAHKTIHLSIQSATTDSTNLIWDAYIGYPFSYYHIFRKDSSTGYWQVIDSVLSNKTTYSDTKFSKTGDTIYYHIDVSAPNDCNATIKNPEPMATTVKSGKSNESERINNNPVSVAENPSDNWLKVYPNPNEGVFMIETSGSKNKAASMKVFNMLGELVYQRALTEKKTEIKLSAVPAGIYHLQVRTEGRTVNRKMVIQ